MKIKSVKTTTYELFEEKEYDKHISNVSKYNEDGLLILSETFNVEGKLTLRESRAYINKQMTEMVIEDLEMHTEQKTEHVYENDILKASIEHLGNDTYIKTNYQYNDKGQITEILKEDELGNFFGKTEYHLSDKSTHKLVYDELMFLTEDETKEYNEENLDAKHSIKQFYPAPDEYQNRAYEIVFDYNEASQLVSEKIYSENQLVVENSYHRNEEGKIVETTSNRIQEKSVIESNFEYNDDGQLTYEEHFNNDIFTHSIEIDYNENQDIIKSAQTFQNQANIINTLVTEKEYEYAQ